MTPFEEIEALGFELTQARRDGMRQYIRRANAYLVYWLTVHPDGTAELTWEHSLGQYLLDKGLAVSGNDELSLLLFPRSEIRGALVEGWAAAAVEEVETVLGSVSLVTGA